MNEPFHCSPPGDRLADAGGKSVGNAVNHNLIQPCWRNITLIPQDLRLVDDDV
jgi:hypothetical protein